MNWSSKPRENPPAGSHVARLFKLVDLGTQQVEWQGTVKSQRKVLLVWELPNAKMAGEYSPELKGQPFAVARRFTQSLHQNSALRGVLESWRGRKFTKDEVAAFDPRKLMGQTCMLNLIEDGEFINVDSVAPLPKGTKVPKPINPPCFFSLEPDEFSQETLNGFGDRLKEQIMASPEYQSLMAAGGKEPQEGPAEDEEPDSRCEDPF